MNETLKKVLLFVVVFTVGGAVGRFSLPVSVVEKEKIVFQDKIVIKEVEKKSVDNKKNKTYIRIVTTKPDGTKTVETRIVDLGEIVTIDTIQKLQDQSSTTVTEKEKTTTYSKDQYLISAGVSSHQWGVFGYGGMVQRRILGPIYIGAFGYSDMSFGLNVGLSF